MRYYHPKTQQKFRSTAEAQAALKVLSPELVEPTVAARPAIDVSDAVTLADLPTQQPDGSWVYGWNVTAKKPTDALVNAERLRRIEAGNAFTVAGVKDPIPLQGRPFDMTVYQTKRQFAKEAEAVGNNDPIHLLRDAADMNYMLTAAQMISLTSQAVQYVEQVMATSWNMKDATGDFPDGIPADFTDDKHWPQGKTV